MKRGQPFVVFLPLERFLSVESYAGRVHQKAAPRSMGGYAARWPVGSCNLWVFECNLRPWHPIPINVMSQDSFFLFCLCKCRQIRHLIIDDYMVLKVSLGMDWVYWRIKLRV